MAGAAIVGMACLFPGAPDLHRYWRNIVDGVDAIGEVPAARWDPVFYDPASKAIDRFYCRRGGFVDDYAQFDPLPFGVVPKAVEAAEPDQLLTLRLGYDALRDAGYLDKPFARERTGVIIGRGNYLTAGAVRLEQHVRLVPQLLQTLRDLFPELPDSVLAAARERLQRELSHYGPDVAGGLMPNLIASRLANRLDVHGPAYTVDAACASALIAVEQACGALHRGEADMMIVGGAHLTHDLTFWATFCQLGALSRSGIIRPLAANADGILAGEGIGLVLLKRLDDALRDGDRVYAVIDGAGSSSDGRSSSLLAPAAGGQRMALQRAWRDVGYAPESIGLLEAHGTATPAGDGVELETVGAFFGSWPGAAARPVIGSVKSMIGHAMPASGMAGLIKTALAIHHGVLPPTLHCEQPHPRLGDTRFRVIARAEPWRQAQAERVAAVNAFGFGGINAHVVLRGVAAPAQAPAKGGVAVAMPPSATASDLPPVLLLSAETPEALLARFDRGECDITTDANPAACRLVVIAPTAKKLALAREAIVSGARWSGRQQIWFAPRGLLNGGGKLAFVFPGVDSRFEPRAADLATYFGRTLPPHCEALDPADSVPKLVVGLLGFNRFLFDILDSLGIRPQGFAGHSVGEWSAMLCAGMMDQALSDRTNAGLDFEAMKFSGVRLLAANCDAARLIDAMQGLEGLCLSHDNCPHQAIACGHPAAVQALAERLHAAGVVTQPLPFVSGFHTPLFADHMRWYREFFGTANLVEPAVAVWSATTAQRYPAALAAKRQLALDHLLQPVRFRPLVENMYDDGFRVFVQVGTGSLAGFIDDTLSGRPHLAIAANHERRSGLQQLQQLCAALWSEGCRFDTRLLASAQTQATQSAPEPMVPPRAGMRTLALGVPLLRVREPLSLPPAAAPSSGIGEIAANDTIGRAVRDTLAEIEQAGRDVLAVWQQRRERPGTGHRNIDIVVQRRLDLNSTVPYLRDHALYPQRDDWPIVADGYPVVPLTMEVMLVREAVEEALPGAKVVEVRDAAAYNWLTVAEPVTVDIRLRSLSDEVIEAEIAGYFKAQVVVGAGYPAADVAALPPLRNPRATAIDAAELYAGRWMFHGPAYRGVTAFEAIGDNGIEGRLCVSVGKGALLDAMAQLAGYWVMEQPDNCLAMPVGVDRIRFFAADPAPGEALECRVRIDRIDAQDCFSSHVLHDAAGRVRIVFDGWHTRRYGMDKAFWSASRLLSRHEVSRSVPPDVAVFEDRYDTALMRDYISRRYLTQSEREVYDSLAPKRRRQWLSGRVAAKDAVRIWLRQRRGVSGVFPQEICVIDEAADAIRLRGNVTDVVPASLRVSIAEQDGLAAAVVGEVAVGIDIQRIHAGDAGAAGFPLSPVERALLAGGDAAADATVDTASDHTRARVAKAAAAKAAGTDIGTRSGSGLQQLVLEARDGDCFRVNGRWIVTHRFQDYILGWTLQLPAVRDALSPAFTNRG